MPMRYIKPVPVDVGMKYRKSGAIRYVVASEQASKPVVSPSRTTVSGVVEHTIMEAGESGTTREALRDAVRSLPKYAQDSDAVALPEGRRQ